MCQTLSTRISIKTYCKRHDGKPCIATTLLVMGTICPNITNEKDYVEFNGKEIVHCKYLKLTCFNPLTVGLEKL